MRLNKGTLLAVVALFSLATLGTANAHGGGTVTNRDEALAALAHAERDLKKVRAYLESTAPKPAPAPAPPPPPGPAPAPGPAPSPPSGSVPVGSKLLFDGSFENGFAGYRTVQTKDRNGKPDGYCTYSACVVDGGPGHKTAARFEVRPGDVTEFDQGSRNERSELIAPSVVDVRAGDERWYSFSAMQPVGQVGPSGEKSGYHFIVMQWHANKSSPPLVVALDTQGRMGLGERWEGSQRKTFGPVPDDKWHDYVIHVKFGNPNGQVAVYRDGALAVPAHSRTTMASDGNYLKLGIYRGQEKPTSVILYDSFKVFAP